MAAIRLEKQPFKPGDRVFREGEPGDKAYLIESGMIEISKKVSGGEQVVVAVVGKRELIGEMALIDGQPRAATARVVKNSVLMIINRADLVDRLKKTDSVIRRLLGVFTKRLREQTSKAVDRTTVIR